VSPDRGGVTSTVGSPSDGPSKNPPSAGQMLPPLFLRRCRSDCATRGWEIDGVEVTAPLCAAPDLANVSFAASMSATTLSETISAPYILYVMASTNSLVIELHSKAG
jgi:hypothetical protein